VLLPSVGEVDCSAVIVVGGFVDVPDTVDVVVVVDMVVEGVGDEELELPAAGFVIFASSSPSWCVSTFMGPSESSLSSVGGFTVGPEVGAWGDVERSSVTVVEGMVPVVSCGVV